MVAFPKHKLHEHESKRLNIRLFSDELALTVIQ